MDIRELKESEQLDVLSEFMYNKLSDADKKVIVINFFRNQLEDRTEDDEGDTERDAHIESLKEEFDALSDRERNIYLEPYN